MKKRTSYTANYSVLLLNTMLMSKSEEMISRSALTTGLTIHTDDFH